MKIRENFFENWKIGKYEISKNDYKLWIANGVWFFKDEGSKILLANLSIIDKYKIWRVFKKENKKRIKQILK